MTLTTSCRVAVVTGILVLAPMTATGAPPQATPAPNPPQPEYPPECQPLVDARDRVWEQAQISLEAEKAAATDYKTKYNDQQFAHCIAPTHVQPPDIQDWYSELFALTLQLQANYAKLQDMSEEKDISAIVDSSKQNIDTCLVDFVRVVQFIGGPQDPKCDANGNVTNEKHDGITPALLDCRARRAWSQIVTESHLRLSATKSLCGGINSDGTMRTFCVSYGIVAASISQLWKIGSQPYGLSTGRLVSVAIPYIGLRWIPTMSYSFLALDLNAYSAYFTSGTLGVTGSQPASCTGAQNALERSLPCEANPQIQPYAAVQFGATLGRDGIGYVTLAPISLGFGSFGNEGVHPYYAMVAGSLQLTGKF